MTGHGRGQGHAEKASINEHATDNGVESAENGIETTKNDVKATENDVKAWWVGVGSGVCGCGAWTLAWKGGVCCVMACVVCVRLAMLRRGDP